MDHHLIALWAVACAQHVLHHFQETQPDDQRPAQALEIARAWVRGEKRMKEARKAASVANAAAREVTGAAKFAALAAGQQKQRLPRSAAGSVNNSRPRFATLSSTTSDNETSSAGTSSHAEPLPRSTVLPVPVRIRTVRMSGTDMGGRRVESLTGASDPILEVPFSRTSKMIAIRPELLIALVLKYRQSDNPPVRKRTLTIKVQHIAKTTGSLQ